MRPVAGILPWRHALPPAEPVPAPEPPSPALTRRCAACDVTWDGTADSGCWVCGKPATEAT